MSGRIRRVARNVRDLERAAEFYVDALGFSVVAAARPQPSLARILGVERAISLHLRLGAQELELTQTAPHGAPYPALGANALSFQHIAIVTGAIEPVHLACLRAGATAISTQGPERLPARAGGVTAWKFRDPDGHPVELLQFPQAGAWHGQGATRGYDHSAISVRDCARSIAFYTSLGFSVRHRQRNFGLAQARLDGLVGAETEVVSLSAGGAPDLELLCYAEPRPPPRRPPAPGDIASDRIVCGGAPAALARDPDGHFILFEP